MRGGRLTWIWMLLLYILLIVAGALASADTNGATRKQRSNNKVKATQIRSKHSRAAPPVRVKIVKVQVLVNPDRYYFERQYFYWADGTRFVTLRFTSRFLPKIAQDELSTALLTQLPEVYKINFDPNFRRISLQLKAEQNQIAACNHFLEVFHRIIKKKRLNISLLEA